MVAPLSTQTEKAPILAAALRNVTTRGARYRFDKCPWRRRLFPRSYYQLGTSFSTGGEAHRPLAEKKRCQRTAYHSQYYWCLSEKCRTAFLVKHKGPISHALSHLPSTRLAPSPQILAQHQQRSSYDPRGSVPTEANFARQYAVNATRGRQLFPPLAKQERPDRFNNRRGHLARAIGEHTRRRNDLTGSWGEVDSDTDQLAILFRRRVQ